MSDRIDRDRPNAQESAYPYVLGQGVSFSYSGFSKREEIAKAAMQGLLSNETYMRSAAEATTFNVAKMVELIAEASVLHADALLAELEK